MQPSLVMRSDFQVFNIPRIFRILLLSCLISGCESDVPNTLRVSGVNPRYFTDNSGRAVYLTGSHTWDNLVDMNDPGEETLFDFSAYISFLKSHNHNFMRLWTWDLLTLGKKDYVPLHDVPLHPWKRSGGEAALDGNPKFDLTSFNELYFDRLRGRVGLAEKEGIYVSVMLFEGWGLQFSEDGYRQHPFHPLNNINALGLDTAHASRLAIYSMENEKVTRLQERYVDKVIENVSGFDNVLYEISNENSGASSLWQYHMIRYVKKQEEERGTMHPVGMTYQFKGGKNEDLFKSPADWISPGPDGGYKTDPPAATGQKVIITDTDHLWGIGGSREWVWKSFLRGMNPIFMDPYKDQVFVTNRESEWEEIRVAMGHTHDFARRMDLINMIPDGSLASSGYCLANAGFEYLVYLPEDQETEIDLTAVDGLFAVTWFDSNSGRTEAGPTVSGTSIAKLRSPFKSKGAVAYVRFQ